MQEPINDNYIKYRGKCKEYCNQLIKDDPTLKLVRGHYYCPIWNRNEAHWWCKKPDGKIVDPTALQFPSNGFGEYTEFDGICTCSNCGNEFHETDENASFVSNYCFCNGRCYGQFVGVL